MGIQARNMAQGRAAVRPRPPGEEDLGAVGVPAGAGGGEHEVHAVLLEHRRRLARHAHLRAPGSHIAWSSRFPHVDSWTAVTPPGKD